MSKQGRPNRQAKRDAFVSELAQELEDVLRLLRTLPGTQGGGRRIHSAVMRIDLGPRLFKLDVAFRCALNTVVQRRLADSLLGKNQQTRRTVCGALEQVTTTTEALLRTPPGVRRVWEACKSKDYASIAAEDFKEVVHHVSLEEVSGDQIEMLRSSLRILRRILDSGQVATGANREPLESPTGDRSAGGPGVGSAAAAFASRPQDPEAISEVAATPEEGATSGMLSCAEIAARFQLEPEPLRHRLHRWRSRHLEGWCEVTDRKPREPRYFYNLSAVAPVIEAARAGI